MDVINKYRNPPLIEAICNFTFSDSGNDLIEIENEIGNLVNDKLPIRKERKNFNVIIQHKENKVHSESNESKSLIQFFDPKKNRMIQIGNKILAVNQLKPYTSWKEFLPFVLEMLDKYLQVSGHKKLAQVSIRYINKIEINKSNINTSDYFNVGVALPKSISEHMLSFGLKSEHLYNKDKDLLQIALNIIPPLNANKFSFLFDTSFVLIKPNNELKNIEKWLQNGHEVLDKVFEDCLTSECKKLFN